MITFVGRNSPSLAETVLRKGNEFFSHAAAERVFFSHLAGLDQN